MIGFERAQTEYESKLFDPYGNEDYEEEYLSREEYLEMQADAMIEEMKLGEL